MCTEKRRRDRFHCIGRKGRGGEVVDESEGANFFDFEGARFGVRIWTWTEDATPRSRQDPILGPTPRRGQGGSPSGWRDRDSSRASDRCARTSGEGRAPSPFVLLHGFAQSARSWSRVASALADGTHASVYALDLMGHGESDHPDGERFYGIGFQARAVLAFCELVAQVEGPRPVLVGYSMGGRVALCAAECVAHGTASDSRSTERAGGTAPGGCPTERQRTLEAPSSRRANVPFRALALESAGLGPADASSRDALAKRNASWAARLREEGVAPFMAYWESLPLFESQKALDAETRAEVSAERLANDANALALTFEYAGAQAMPVRSEAIRALRVLAEAGVPAAYLAGALDAKYRAAAESLKAELGRAIDVRIVPNAGHNVHLEQPEAFAAELLGFAGNR